VSSQQNMYENAKVVLWQLPELLTLFAFETHLTSFFVVTVLQKECFFKI